MEKDTIFGILYALKYTKIDDMKTEQKQLGIMEWLCKQGSKDLPEEERKLQSIVGEEFRYEVYAQWDALRDGLSALISDKDKLRDFVLSKAYQNGNKQLLENMGI